MVAVDAETEEWVLRFDATYGEVWDAGWQFEDPPESDLQFQRTGREMVFFGEIEEDDEIPVYVKKKIRRGRGRGHGRGDSRSGAAPRRRRAPPSKLAPRVPHLKIFELF